jgi:GDSL-like Lipase/Acylhydrolase family
MVSERRPFTSELKLQELRRGKRWLLRLAMVAVGLGVAVLLTEAGLWMFAPIGYHEFMQWIPDGHIKGRGALNQVFQTADGYEVRINRLGFRGPDYTWMPAAGTLRVAAFGGSSTFCHEAHGEENTWPGRLQSYLSEALRMPVEVVNLGLPGFDASNSKINYLFTGRALHPHVALMYHTWNDMKFFRLLAREPVVFAKTVSSRPSWQRSVRVTQIGRRVRNAVYAMGWLETENYYTSLKKEGQTANQPVVPAALEWARQNYDDFVSLARSDGVLPVLISQATIVAPVNFDKPEYRAKISTNPVGMTIPILYRTWREVSRVLEEVAREEGAIFVDGYNAVPHDFQHLADTVHLRDAGSNVLARAIAETVLKDPRFLEVVERVRNGSGPRAVPRTEPAGAENR